MGSRDKIILDTNIIIYLLNGAKDLSKILKGNQIAYSVISEIELLSFSGLSESDEKNIVDFLSECYPLEIDKKVRQLAIEIRKRHGLKVPDAIIAASAYVHNYQLVTADSDFLKVDGLYIVKYEP